MGAQTGLMEKIHSHKTKIGFVIGLACFGVLSYFLSSSTVLKDYVKQLAIFIREKPVEGAAIYVFISTCITVSGIPFAFVDLAAAAVYPLRTALALSFMAKTLGALGCFTVTRCNLIPGSFRENLLSNPFVSRINRHFTSSPLYYAILMRFSSVPMVLKNYGLCCLDVSLLHFMTACMCGSIIFVPIQVMLGKSLASQVFGFDPVDGDGDGGNAQVAQTAGAAVAFLSLAKCASHFSGTILNKADEEGAAPSSSANVAVLKKEE